MQLQISWCISGCKDSRQPQGEKLSVVHKRHLWGAVVDWGVKVYKQLHELQDIRRDCLEIGNWEKETGNVSTTKFLLNQKLWGWWQALTQIWQHVGTHYCKTITRCPTDVKTGRERGPMSAHAKRQREHAKMYARCGCGMSVTDASPLSRTLSCTARRTV
jgi:hypothetical protein